MAHCIQAKQPKTWKLTGIEKLSGMRIEKLLLLAFCVPLVACGNDMFDKFDLHPVENNAIAEKTVWKPVDCTINEVKFSSFRINAMNNDKVLADLVFNSFREGDTSRVSVNHYFLKKTHIVPSWNCVAAKVTVNGEEQTPDFSEVDFSNPVTYRLFASDGQYKEYTFSLEQGDYTGFQVVSIISERTISNKKAWASSVFKISGQESGYSDVSYSSEAKLRGNNSLQFRKKSYTVRLDGKASILGMSKHTHWCLLAGAPDRTRMRNRVAFEIASRTGLPWTPDSRFCELFVNSEYCGLYLLTEKIKIDKRRVNITKMDKSDTTGVNITGGYLLECDHHPDNLSFETAVRHLPVNIKSPDEDNITGSQIDYIENYFKTIEQKLYRTDVPDPEYRKLIDLESFADVWIVLELTRCEDARLPGSVWYYKDRNGPLCAGPVWDFDLTTFSNNDSYLLYDYETSDFSLSDRSLWYSRLFLDPVFKDLVKRRWQSYYPSFQTIPDFIDRQAEIIRKSVTANDETWPYPITGNPDAYMTWEGSLEELKQNYLNRLHMLNDFITSW